MANDEDVSLRDYFNMWITQHEKLVEIKDASERDARQLARENQNHRDEKANQLREQIGSERGLYATRADLAALREYFDALHRPVVEYIASQTGRSQGLTDGWKILIASLSAFATVLAIIGGILAVQH